MCSPYVGFDPIWQKANLFTLYYIKMTKILQEFCEIFLFQNFTNFFGPCLRFAPMRQNDKKISIISDKKITKNRPLGRVYFRFSSLYMRNYLPSVRGAAGKRGKGRKKSGKNRHKTAFVQFDECLGKKQEKRLKKTRNFFVWGEISGGNGGKGRSAGRRADVLCHGFANKSRRSLVYHPQLVAVYHQHEVLYIIKPQENARWRVMRYKGARALDDMRRTSCVDDMPSLRLG